MVMNTQARFISCGGKKVHARSKTNGANADGVLNYSVDFTGSTDNYYIENSAEAINTA